MNRLFKLPLLIALTLGSTQLLAVDFGQVRVMSNLGQPLRAEIPVRGATPAELQNLTAKLASGDDYERAGISGGRTKVPLSFSVVAGPGGQHFIRITSTAPVDDPYLDLLLDVNTAAGKSVHEFAILLDPPGTPESAIASGSDRSTMRSPATTGGVGHKTASARTEANKPASGKQGAPAAHAAAVAANKPAGAVVKGMYGPVERGQTLSGIAQQTLPAGVDINQMLLAIKQANPDAFYRDNINTLKTGVVLRVPSAADAEATTVASAIAEVRRQNSDWRGGSAATPTTVADTATRAATSSAPATAAAKSGDRLALLAAKDTGNAGGAAVGNTGGHAGESAAELRKSLLRAQEGLASEQQQVADLKSHLKELNDVNSKSERLLSLKDNEIAELQAKLAAARKSGPAGPASSATSKTALAEGAGIAPAKSATGAMAASAAMVPAAGKAVASAASVAAATSAPVAATAAAASPKPPANAKPVSTPKSIAKPATGAQPWYMQTWAWIAGAGIVVLLILAGLLGRQRKRPAPAVAKSAPSLADSFTAGSPPSGLSADDVDQEELLDQLAEHPDDIGLHLQLVTLYYARRDVEHFEAAAEAMYAHITDPQQDEWQDVVHMGEDLVPEHPLFSHHVQPPVSASHAPLEDFNIDDYADDAAPTRSEPVVLTSSSAPMNYPTVSDSRVDFTAGAPSGFHAVSDQLDVSPEAPATDVDVAPVEVAPVRAAEAASGPAAEGVDDELGEFNDDPIDTKLDLARAYLDMGDEEGARAMLDEVLKEGSQMQKDVAASLLGGLQH